MSDHLFAQATRMKLRFPSGKGELNLEDLWDLPITKLDEMGISIKTDLESSQGKSLRRNASPMKGSGTLQLKLDIIQFIINTREDEAERHQQQQTLASDYQKVKELIASKREANLANLPEEDLLRMADDLKKRMAEM
jgi:hypothetical protein